MRRNDREVTDAEVIEDFIAGEKIMRVGFYDSGEVYIVPVNYGYSVNNGKYTFYFHGAPAGRKFELAETSPSTGFEIDGRYSLIPADTACGHSAKFMSVIGTGRLHIINDNDEKIKALNCLMKQTTGKDKWDYSEQQLKGTAVFRLEAEKLSCKAK